MTITAVEKGDLTLVEAYLKKNAKKYLAKKTFSNDLEAIHIAAKNLDHDMVELLLKYGANPNSEYVHSHGIGYGYIAGPLIQALSNNNTQIDKLLRTYAALLKGGADPNITTYCDQRPLIYVIRDTNFNEENIIKIYDVLLTSGAHLNCYYGDDKFKPIHMAASKGYTQLIEFLLKRGENINAMSGKGKTPLFIAAERGKSNCVRFLLGQGADPDFNPNLTCLKAAFENGHENICTILKDHKKGKNAAHAAAPATPDEWTILNNESIAHITEIAALNRKITEIFNFTTCERVKITENLLTKAETQESKKFSEISPQSLQQAREAFMSAGGKPTIDIQPIKPMLKIAMTQNTPHTQENG